LLASTGNFAGALQVTGVATFTAATVLAADSIDAITEIATAIKSGADGKLMTGTAGAANKLAMFNGDGDVVDSTVTVADLALNSKVVAVPITSTGSQAVTGVGFQPTAIIFLSGIAGTNNSVGVGLVDSALGHFSSNFYAANNDNNTNSGVSATSIKAVGAPYEFTVTALGADGFTYNVTDADAATTVYALCQR